MMKLCFFRFIFIVFKMKIKSETPKILLKKIKIIKYKNNEINMLLFNSEL